MGDSVEGEAAAVTAEGEAAAVTAVEGEAKAVTAEAAVEGEAAAVTVEPAAGSSASDAVVGKARIDSATSLWRAAEHGDLGRLKRLLEAGHDINAREQHENRGECRHKTPLSAAVDGNEPLAVRLLLRKGADPNLSDGDGDRSPLHWASAFGDYDECAELLVLAGASLDARDKYGHTPLEFARGSASGSVHGFKRLGATLLGQPAGREKVIAVLERAAAAVDRPVWSHERAKAVLTGAYWKAAASGDLPALERCLAQGQPVDQPRPAAVSRMSTLAIAAFNGRTEAVALLLARGADASRAEAEGGYTPLHFCAYDGDHVECARLLLAAGADPEVKKGDGESAAAFATKRKREATGALLDAAAARQRAAAALAALLDNHHNGAWLAPSANALSEAIEAARRAGVDEELKARATTTLEEIRREEASRGGSTWTQFAYDSFFGASAPPPAVEATTAAAVAAEAGAHEAPMEPAPPEDVEMVDVASAEGHDAGAEPANPQPSAGAEPEAESEAPPHEDVAVS